MDIGVSSHLVDLSLDRCVDECLKLTIEGSNKLNFINFASTLVPDEGLWGLGLLWITLDNTNIQYFRFLL